MPMPADDVAETVANEDRGDLVETREVPHHPDGFPQHQPSLPGPPFLSCRRRRAQRIGQRAEDAARDRGEPRAELARRPEPRDRRVSRSGRELLREIAHRQRHLLAGLRAGFARIAQGFAELRLHGRARPVGDLPDGREEIVFELAQIRERCLQLAVGEGLAARGELFEGRVPGLGGGAQRLVDAVQGLGHRAAHVGAALLRPDRRTLGDRADHVAHAVTIEALALQRGERELVHLGADVGALAHRLARGGLDAFVRQILGSIRGHGMIPVWRSNGAILAPTPDGRDPRSLGPSRSTRPCSIPAERSPSAVRSCVPPRRITVLTRPLSLRSTA